MDNPNDTASEKIAQLEERLQRVERYLVISMEQVGKLEARVADLEWRADRNIADPKANRLRAYLHLWTRKRDPGGDGW